MQSAPEDLPADRSEDLGVIAVDVIRIETDDHPHAPGAGDAAHVVSEPAGGVQHPFSGFQADARIGSNDPRNRCLRTGCCFSNIPAIDSLHRFHSFLLSEGKIQRKCTVFNFF